MENVQLNSRKSKLERASRLERIFSIMSIGVPAVALFVQSGIASACPGGRAEGAHAGHAAGAGSHSCSCQHGRKGKTSAQAPADSKGSPQNSHEKTGDSNAEQATQGGQDTLRTAASAARTSTAAATSCKAQGASSETGCTSTER
jgi:hypothetical protein